MKLSFLFFCLILVMTVNCLTRYKKEIPDSNIREAINKIMIKLNYKNMNPDIVSFEMEPQIDEKFIKSIALKHNIKNITFTRDQDSTSHFVKEYDIVIRIDIYFYPTIQNVSALFLFPAVSTAKFKFNMYNKEEELLHSAIFSRDNIYFLLCLPLSLFFYDDNADEKILNDYFRFLSSKITERSSGNKYDEQ